MAKLLFCFIMISSLFCYCSSHRFEDSSEIRIKEKSRSKKVLVFENKSRESDPHIARKHSKKPSTIRHAKARIPEILENSTCIEPQPRPTKRHRAFLVDLLSHGTYVTMADRASLDSISIAITNKPWNSKTAHSACFRILWKLGDKRLYGYDQIKKPICPEDDLLDTKCFCSLDPTHEKMHSFTAVWTDGRHHALIAGCSALGHGGWKVLSNTRTISPKTKKRVLAELAKHKVNLNGATELPSKLCPRYVKDTAFDGYCDPHIRGLNSDYKAKIFRILSKGVYTPMSNMLNIYGQSRFLRGATILKDKELNHLCRKDIWRGNELTIHGFGNHTGVLHCDAKDISNIECFPDDKKSTNKHIFIYNTKMTMVWTDKKRNVLVVSCLTSNVKTWALYSTTKTVDSDTENFIARKIRKYGFDPNKIYMNPYDHCGNL